MKKNFLKTAFAGLIALPLLSQADTIGVYAGTGLWQSDFSGNIGASNTPVSDLNYNSSTNNTFFIALEHPIPLIPNIRIDSLSIEDSSNTRLNTSFQLDDIIQSSNTALATDFDLSQLDATLYYEVLDNWVNLDFGLTLRKYSGDVSVSSSNTQETAGIDGYLPLIYTRAKAELPLTGLSVGAHAQGITYSGDSVSDLSINIAYDFNTPVIELGVEVGYRQQSLELNDLDSLDSDLTLKGPYASVNFHF